MLTATFVQSATILLREGLEAILVLAALGAYLARTGAGERTRALYGGAVAAVIASLAMAWALERFNNGMHDDRVEAVVIFAAAGLMFWVSGWLFLKQDPRAWQAYLQQQTDRMAGRGTAVAVAAIAFLAVFREGAETVLFLHVLAKTGGGWDIGLVGGLMAAALALSALFLVINRQVRRLPLRTVFLATSAFLFVMGLKFVGEGIQELQEQALLDVHSLPAGNSIAALGFNASWEAVALQLLIVATALVGLLLVRRERATA